MNIKRLSLNVLLFVALLNGLLVSSAHALTATTTTLTASASVLQIDQSAVLTATVTGAVPTGSVSFNVTGFGTLGTAPLVSGKAILAIDELPAMLGTFAVQAVYSGDTNNSASTSPSVSVTITKKTTSIDLSVTPSPAYQGQSLTIQAIVNGYGATGVVVFKDGSLILGSSPLEPIAGGSKATWTTTLTGLNHSLSASYAGNAYNTASVSAVLPLQIGIALPISSAPVVNYEYDAEGHPTKTVQAPGTSNFTTRATYDTLNRLKDTTDAKSGITRFGYDGLDRTTRVTDPRNLVTQYPRNGLGDTKQLISPDTGTATQTYDAAGNLKSRTDSRGVKASFYYDALNRLTSLTYSQINQTSLTFVWQYDITTTPYGIGRLGSAIFPGGSLRYTYDAQGRVLTQRVQLAVAAGANAVQLLPQASYGYDAAGHVTSITYPSGRKLSITYTGGVPSAIALAPNATAAATPLLSQIQWQPFGPVKSWRWHLASGTQAHERVYDTSGRLVRYRLGNTIRDLTYDAADRISAYTHYDAATTAAQPTLNQSFGYDELGRLKQTTLYAGSLSFSYDANGNRTAATVNGNTSGYAVSTTSNRIDSISNPARSFAYDSTGNTTADGQFSATYDLTGRMKTLTKAGITTTYTYDNDGRRVRKFDNTGAASTVVFFHDLDGHLLGEFDQTGKAIREFVWLGDTLIAVFTPDPVSAANPPLVYYVHSDHLNTPRVIVDKNNAIRWRWFAEPFGTTAAESNPSNLGNFTFNLRFPGQYFDQESGLHYNWHRYYDPTSGGRYTTSDPIGLAGGINTYLYSQAAPTMYTDPTGLFTSSTHNEITTAAIAIAGSPCQNLPAAVANADWFPGSQAPQNAHWHAMRDGTNPSATVDSARRDYNDFVDGQWKSCTCEGLARAMHAVQDSYARGHANFQPWSGGLPSVSHAHADGYPSRSEREGAINASVELIRRHGKECKEQCPR